MRPRVRLAAAVLAFVGALSLTLAARGQFSPAVTAAQIDLADVLFAHGDYRGALGVYLRAAGTESPALRDRARAGVVRTALRIGEFDLASAHASALVASAPGDAQALSLSGDASWALGLFEEAEAAYREAIAADTSAWRAHNGLAKSLASRGRPEEALLEARLALASGGELEPEAHHTLAQLHEALRDYQAAADGYARFLARLPDRDRRERGPWTGNLVTYLRAAFRDRVPYELASDPDATYVLPFKIERDKVVVRAKLNGKSMDFAVDTGAERTVVTVATARRLGIRPLVQTMSAGVGGIGLRGLQLGVAKSLEVGGLTLRNVPVIIKDPPLEGLPTKERESLSPLALGFSMSVDYQARRLTMARRLAASQADVTLPLRMHRLATVRGVVNDRPVSFIVDTGGEVISLNTAVARSLFKPADWRRIWLKVYGASGWDRDAYLLPGVNLGFEEIRYHNTPIVVMNLEVPSALLGYQIGGTLGHRFLSRYRVDVDLQASEVRLNRAH